MNINEIAKEIHDNAVAHGWWDEPRSFGEIIALCHSELSETLEEYRNKKPMFYFLKKDRISAYYGESDCDECDRIDAWNGEKPEGIATELADTVIRILDYLAQQNITVDKLPTIITDDNIYDKKDFGTFITICHLCLSYAYGCSSDEDDDFVIKSELLNCVSYIYYWAKYNSVDMDEIIRIKHTYNKTRPYRHGGKAI